ncbi:MAG: hypothetical protein AAF430_25145 [Myxococcota bacterium]
MVSMSLLGGCATPQPLFLSTPAPVDGFDRCHPERFQPTAESRTFELELPVRSDRARELVHDHLSLYSLGWVRESRGRVIATRGAEVQGLVGFARSANPAEEDGLPQLITTQRDFATTISFEFEERASSTLVRTESDPTSLANASAELSYGEAMLKRISCAVALMRELEGAPSAGAGSDGAEVPAGTPVLLYFGETVRSNAAKAGDAVTLRVAQDVYADGKVVIEKGARALGAVRTAAESKAFRGDGSLGLSIDSVETADGGTVSVRWKVDESLDRSQGRFAASGLFGGEGGGPGLLGLLTAASISGAEVVIPIATPVWATVVAP